MRKKRILIVDDNDAILQALEWLLTDTFGEITTLTHPKQLPFLLQQNPFDLVLLDMNFSPGARTGNEGLFWLREIKNLFPDICVVLMTAYGDVELAVHALKEGATDFVVKPWTNEKLLSTLSDALKMVQTQKKSHQKERNPSHSEDREFDLIGSSPIWKQLMEVVKKVARTDASILITGEHGTGKELIAQEIHRLSKRNSMKMVNLDMGAISELLFESELFGHVKGAFTDAREDRMGKFEQANASTLFLDEIGNLPLHLQSKLLVALQRREVFKVGANVPIPIDIRLISATNSRLSELIAERKFREDLLFRINTIQLEVPPLRDRGNDILLLAEHFMNLYSVKYERKSLTISEKAKIALLNYIWPGNVRELQHVMEKTVILSDPTELLIDDFGFPIRPNNASLPLTLEEMEQKMIAEALERHEGNYSAAARQLGITRQTLYNKLKKGN